MKPWIEDILDQLTTADLLAHTNISCGERLAMITVDNAVEYMCKAYVEVYKSLIPAVIKKKDWEAKKAFFAHVIDFVATQEPRLGLHVTTIKGYHDIRNSLYHSGQPLSVKAHVIDDYAKRARSILEILLGVKENEEAHSKRTAAIHASLLGEAAKEVKAGVTFETVNDGVRFSTGVEVKLPDAICLVLYGFAKEKGKSPSIAELHQSLSFSGHTPTKETIGVRLSELRKKGVVRKGELKLTAPGRTYLLRKYLL